MTNEYSKADMKKCFEESRLTHPMLGFKHQTFEEYLHSLSNTKEHTNGDAEELFPYEQCGDLTTEQDPCIYCQKTLREQKQGCYNSFCYRQYLLIEK